MQGRQKSSRDQRLIEQIRNENRTLESKINDLVKERDRLRENLRDQVMMCERLPGGLFVIQNNKVVYLNETALRETGYGSEEIIGRPVADLFRSDSTEWIARIQRKRGSADTINTIPECCEIGLITRRGRAVRFPAMANRIRYGGRIALLLNFICPYEGHRGQSAGILSVKEELLSTVMSGLFDRLKPVLETIVPGIRNMANLVDADPKVLRRLRTMEAACERLEQTAGILRKLGLKEGADGPRSLIDLKKLVRKSISDSDPAGGKGGPGRNSRVNLKTYLRPVSPVRGNAAEIQSVFMGLLQNAVDALPGGGDIYVTTEENAGFAYIYIQDNGPGIPEEIRERIFDAFFTTKGREHSGIGLTLARAAVRRDKGDIEVTSFPGQGTTVSVKLPVDRSVEGPQADSTRKRTKNLRILVIDDDSIPVKLLIHILSGKGFEVVAAAGFKEGVNLLKKRVFHLFLARLEAGHVRNQTLLANIRRISPGLPLLVLEQGDGRRSGDCSRIVPDRVIKEPFDMKRVLDEIAALTLRAG